jgi:hypothetical protein
VKRLIAGVVFVLVAVSASAVTVVLKDGRRIQVASAEQRGNYLIVRHESGRVESYPLAAVDQEGTRRAAAAPAPTPAPTPAGPQSPFARAVSSGGEATATLTDEDLPRRVGSGFSEGPVDEDGEEEPKAPGARVEMLGYEYSKVGEEAWDITVTVTNRGVLPATGVGAVVRLLGDEGQSFGTGSGRMDGNLASGADGRIVARVQATEEPSQVSVSLQWQVVEPETEQVETREPVRSRQLRSPDEGVPPETRFLGRPEGSSPMSLPTNPMARPSPVLQPQPGQVPPPPPAPR